MADHLRSTRQVVFSWNEGHTWYDFDMSEQSDAAMAVDNVITNSGATTTKFLLYGTRSSGATGALVFLDFEALGQPLCKGVPAADSVSSDYETWSPWDGKSAERCILGRQLTYTRRKQSSECFNGERFERPRTRKNCPCSAADFECELGFARVVGATECQLVGELAAPASCNPGSSFPSPAYRKVVGDSCDGGWQPPLAQVPCPAKLSRGAMPFLGSLSFIVAVVLFVAYLSRERADGQSPETALESVGQWDHRDEGEADIVVPAKVKGLSVRHVDAPTAPVPRLQAPGRGAAKGDADGATVDLL